MSPTYLVLVYIVAAAVQGAEPPTKDAAVAGEGGRTLGKMKAWNVLLGN